MVSIQYKKYAGIRYRQIADEVERTNFIKAWETAFSRTLSPEMYLWIFNNGMNSLYAAFNEEKVVAGYCLLKYNALLNQKIFNAVLCNNVFVLHGYHDRDLFVKLGRFALKKAEKQGIKLAISIPNRYAIMGHMRTGWTLLPRINFLERKRQDSGVEKRTDARIVSLTSDNCSLFLNKIEEFSIEISKARSFSVIKDSLYFEWRYVSRPDVEYKIFVFMNKEDIAGYVVFKYYEVLNRLHIIDIEVIDEYVFNALLGIADSFPEPYSLVNIWETSIYKNYLMSSGFSVSQEFSHLLAIYPDKKDKVSLGDKVNFVIGDNDIF